MSAFLMISIKTTDRLKKRLLDLRNNKNKDTKDVKLLDNLWSFRFLALER